MRLFVGIPLAAVVVEQLSAISMRLQSSEDGLRWSTPESWHITLQFLGETGQEQYACIVAALRALRWPPVPIQMEGLGCFDRVGVFFAGVALTPELHSLQQQVTLMTGGCGFIPETRSYHPHVTLARTRGKASAKALKDKASAKALKDKASAKALRDKASAKALRDKASAKALDGLNARSQRQPAFSNFVAEEFVLYQSVTGPTGSRYEIREHFHLDED